MRPIDPRFYLDDPDAKSLGPLTYRSDLTAPDIPTMGTGRYVIARETIPKGQVWIIKTIVPFAQERVNVGLGTESVQMMDPLKANNWFTFEPYINGSSPFILKADMNTPRAAAGPLQNNDRFQSAGITCISVHPWSDAQRSMFNPLFTIVVRAARTFTVVFSVLPQSSDPAAALPTAGTYAVGGAGGARRVDFAGVVLSGVQMSEQLYDDMQLSLQREGRIA